MDALQLRLRFAKLEDRKMIALNRFNGFTNERKTRMKWSDQIPFPG